MNVIANLIYNSFSLFNFQCPSATLEAVLRKGAPLLYHFEFPMSTPFLKIFLYFLKNPNQILSKKF